MAGFMSMKMKRKDLEEVNDDFSDFSLSSPARKMRRLDVDLPPIMEEEEPEVPFGFKQQPTTNKHIPSYMDQTGGLGSCPIMEELPIVPENEEKALVLFRPMSSPLLLSPSNFSVSVNSDIISGIKNQMWSVQSNAAKYEEDKSGSQGLNTTRANESLALVPWVPSQVPSTQGIEVPEAELMESDDAGAATMDIEENDVATEPGKGWQLSGMTNGFQNQWQQKQHCMIPQLPQNTSTPIVWYR